jgi:hypothetical protein
MYFRCWNIHIGDYRGKSGKWTEMDQGKIDVDHLFDDNVDHSPNKKQKLHGEGN